MKIRYIIFAMFLGFLIRLDAQKFQVKVIDSFTEDSYYVAITFLNFSKLESKVKIGFNRSRENNTLFKLYSNTKDKVYPIPNPMSNKFYNLAMEITVAKLK